MRKNGITMRVGAVILAASMIMVDAVPTLAAGVVNDVSVEQELTGSVNGVSKVIGLDGKVSDNYLSTLYSEDDTVEKKYVKVNKNDTSVIVAGQKDTLLDAATGLYKVGDTYYAYAYNYSTSLCELGDKVAYVGTVTPDEDAATGLYVANGKYYSGYDYNTNTTGDVLAYYVLESSEVDVLATVASDVDYRALYGKKLADTDTSYKYYEVNGKAYRYIYAHSVASGMCVYAYKTSEISFDKRYQYIRWNAVSNATEVASNGKPIQIGYQVKENGEVAALSEVGMNGNAVETFNTWIGYTSDKAYAEGESASYEVRAIYYTTDNATGVNTIVKTGEWSDPYSYAWVLASQTVPQVTGLAAVQRSVEVVRLSWNKVDVASGYYIQRLRSAEAITDFAAVESKWEDWDSTSDTSYQVGNSDFGYVYVTDANGDSQRVECKYVYYRVAAYVDYDEEKFVETTGEYSAPVGITENAQINTPAITGLKVENNTDGSFILKWNNIDAGANVRVFYSDDKSMFNTLEYTYELADAWGVDAATDDEVYLTDTYSLQDKLTIVDKKVDYSNLSAGANSVSSDSLGLVPGRKYYFVVATYDASNRSVDRSAITPYVANVSRVAGETRNVAFGHYTDVAVSSVVSAKKSISVTQPSTKSDKTSITMTFNKLNASITGYEISRKNGKKYKKIATISSAQYVDKELKENTVYDYKVRAYYYNPDTNDKAYSDYVYFSAETSTNNYVILEAEKSSKTAVKLSWTKVAGATKYEIYRSNTVSTDTNYSKKNGYGNGNYALGNAKWELVKTINKAKTVTYTDKKLKSGETYSYRIVATYKSGKTTKQIYATDSVVLKLTAPQDIKTTLSKNNVKVTWDKDKYASKYEVSYIKYDAQDNAETEDWVVATTKKASYTIKNVAAGGYVEVRVRAYGGKQWSGYNSTTQAGKELAVAKSVTAKEITEKNAKGEESTAVKISWKKVSGAAYYIVYRSTSPAARYNTDEKYYYGANDSMSLISKESNDDERSYYANVYYDDYKGQNGTIVGTSAVDRARLQTGVTYYYYVTAFSADGQRVSVGYSKPASICYKATPSIKKVTAKKGKTVVTINKVTGAKKYVIYRSTKKNSGYKQIGTTTKTTYTDKTTKKGKTYYYKVVAVGTNGLKADFESAASKAVKVKAK